LKLRDALALAPSFFWSRPASVMETVSRPNKQDRMQTAWVAHNSMAALRRGKRFVSAEFELLGDLTV